MRHKIIFIFLLFFIFPPKIFAVKPCIPNSPPCQAVLGAPIDPNSPEVVNATVNGIRAIAKIYTFDPNDPRIVAYIVRQLKFWQNPANYGPKVYGWDVVSEADGTSSLIIYTEYIGDGPGVLASGDANDFTPLVEYFNSHPEAREKFRKDFTERLGTHPDPNKKNIRWRLFKDGKYDITNIDLDIDPGRQCIRNCPGRFGGRKSPNCPNPQDIECVQKYFTLSTEKNFYQQCPSPGCKPSVVKPSAGISACRGAIYTGVAIMCFDQQQTHSGTINDSFVRFITETPVKLTGATLYVTSHISMPWREPNIKKFTKNLFQKKYSRPVGDPLVSGISGN